MTPAAQTRTVRLRQFLDDVQRTNLDLAANRFNVPIAEAQIAVAKVFPDPEVSLSASPLNSVGAPASFTVGVAQTVELGGKRHSRVAEATEGKSVAEAQLEDFFQTLRVSAADAFIDSLAAREILDRKRRTLESVEKLVTANEQRLRAGDIGPAALLQVKVEAERFRADVISAEADVRTADYALELFLGGSRSGVEPQLQPVGTLQLPSRNFEAKTLVAGALERRSDLIASLRAQDQSEAHFRVAQSNRWIDLSLGADWSHTNAASGSYGAIAPSLAYDAAGFSIGFPLPFSHVWHGELDAARAASQQAATQTASVRRRVEIDVLQSLARYEATRRAVAVYTGEILSDADKVLEATRYSYERGAARLFELIDAQRTEDDVYLSYVAALAANAKALVALERAGAFWDLEF
ncbi:MAG TPA: TolC family protein [Thermoanaerobaculia bacterium]